MNKLGYIAVDRDLFLNKLRHLLLMVDKAEQVPDEEVTFKRFSFWKMKRVEVKEVHKQFYKYMSGHLKDKVEYIISSCKTLPYGTTVYIGIEAYTSIGIVIDGGYDQIEQCFRDLSDLYIF